MAQAKLKTARNQTSSSPVAGIKDLAFWLEATGENSFDSGDQEDGSLITNWYDIGPQSPNKNNFSNSGNARPSYTSNCINGLPCVKFNGSNYLGITNVTPETTSQVTVFIVVMFDTISTVNASSLLMTNGAWIANGSMHIQAGGSSPAKLSFGIVSRTPNDIWGVTNTNYTTARPYIINAVDNSATVTAYVNGVNDMSSTQTITTAGTARIYDNKIGGYYDGTSMTARYLYGRIGELIVFSRGLKSEERKAVTLYLGKKWGITTS